MPPIKCTPCRVTYQGQHYHVQSNGDVHPTYPDAYHPKQWFDGERVDKQVAKLVRQEASRQRRNRNARERNQAMRDLGMKKTSYGWE